MIGSVTIKQPGIRASISGPGLQRTVTVARSGGASVRLVGTQGPAGASGSGGGSTYTHTQSSALASWTVAHNLGRKPSITVVDNLDNRIEPDVTYLDTNTVRVTHASALIGKVYCN